MARGRNGWERLRAVLLACADWGFPLFLAAVTALWLSMKIAGAQQLVDYDSALAPHLAASPEFCAAAPACRALLGALDANGNPAR